MLLSGLLIHLSGGRIESHFHVFGSLAFLAFYRDWRVVIVGSIVVVLDHALRGLYWPESIYGALGAALWRTAEHAGWVAFEDVFLVGFCVQCRRDLRRIAEREAELEAARELAEHGEALSEMAERLQASEAAASKLALVASRTDNLVIISDADGRIEWTNRAFTMLTGFEPEEVVGRKPGSFLQGPETDPATVAHMRRAAGRGAGLQRRSGQLQQVGPQVLARHRRPADPRRCGRPDQLHRHRGRRDRSRRGEGGAAAGPRRAGGPRRGPHPRPFAGPGAPAAGPRRALPGQRGAGVARRGADGRAFRAGRGPPSRRGELSQHLRIRPGRHLPDDTRGPLPAGQSRPGEDLRLRVAGGADRDAGRHRRAALRRCRAPRRLRAPAGGRRHRHGLRGRASAARTARSSGSPRRPGPCATPVAGSSSSRAPSRTSPAASRSRRNSCEPRRRPRPPAAPRASSWPTSATRSARR